MVITDTVVLFCRTNFKLHSSFLTDASWYIYYLCKIIISVEEECALWITALTTVHPGLPRSCIFCQIAVFCLQKHGLAARLEGGLTTSAELNRTPGVFGLGNNCVDCMYHYAKCQVATTEAVEFALHIRKYCMAQPSVRPMIYRYLCEPYRYVLPCQMSARYIK